MTPRLRSIAAAMALLIAPAGGLTLAETRSVRAAEVECIVRVGDRTPFPEDFAKEAWPSGFRPTVDTCFTGYLHGTIVNGDYDKVAALYRANHKASEKFFPRIARGATLKRR